MSPKWSILLGVLAVILVVAEARRERATTTTSSSSSNSGTLQRPSKLNDQKPKVQPAKPAGLKERVDEAVEKVKAKSREQRMESEKKRVERKLRRDQKKLEKELSKVEPQNPHNLKMPDCSPQGMVYNGRRCVPPSKMRV